jgi:1-acyl-sn-glycerol-3-phosphate acyltransferase
MIIWQVLYLVSPLILAGIVHSIAIKKDLFSALRQPIDGGKLFQNKEIFGKNKTWRGILITVVVSICVVAIQKFLYSKNIFVAFSLINYQNIGWLQFGFLLGIAYSIAELPNSFIKRRIGIKAGEINQQKFLLQYLIDQIDSSIGVVLVLFFFYSLQWKTLIAIFLIGTLVHIIIDQLLFFFRVKSWNTIEPPTTFYTIYLSQLLIWPILEFLLRIVFRGIVIDNLILPNRKDIRYIVVANHQSVLDPFMLTVAISGRTLVRILPFRYMTANSYIERGLSGWLLKCLGAFPAFQTNTEAYGLEKGAQVLDLGQTLCMFPEGKRTLTKASPPKPGIAQLANLPNIYIIPILIEWSRAFPVRKLKITVGKAYTGMGYSAEAILASVYALSQTQEIQTLNEQSTSTERNHKVIKTVGKARFDSNKYNS